MKDKTLMVERMSHIVAPAERGTLSSVCIKGGCAYASDGRIAAKWEFENPDEIEDSIPDQYPIDRLIQIIGVADSADSWYVVGSNSYGDAEREFLEKYRKEKSEHDRIDRCRYKEVHCPCCHSYVYWDTYEEELVEDIAMHKLPVMVPRDCEFPVVLVFGEERLPVGFGYLITIMNLFGDKVLFGLEKPNDGDVKKLVFRSEDGSIKGVLMPLRVLDGEDMKGSHEIAMLRV